MNWPQRSYQEVARSYATRTMKIAVSTLPKGLEEDGVEFRGFKPVGKLDTPRNQPMHVKM